MKNIFLKLLLLTTLLFNLLFVSCTYWRIMGDGNEYFETGEYIKALETYKLSLKAKRHVGAYFHLAKTYSALELFDSTKLMLAEGIKYYPEQWVINSMLGNFYINQECKPDSALPLLQKAYKKTKLERLETEIKVAQYLIDNPGKCEELRADEGK